MSIDWSKYKPSSATLSSLKPVGGSDFVQLVGTDTAADAATAAATRRHTMQSFASPTRSQSEATCVASSEAGDEAELQLKRLREFSGRVDDLLAAAGSGLELIHSLEKQYQSATSKMHDLHSQCKHLVNQQVRGSCHS
jgi:hypothetical protein